MEQTDKYAYITVTNKAFGDLDIMVSRDIPAKELIRNLYNALGADKSSINAYYAKAERAKVLLTPTDTLRDKGIYDGDTLRIL